MCVKVYDTYNQNYSLSTSKSFSMYESYFPLNVNLARSYGNSPYSQVVHIHLLGSLPQTAELIFLGSPNNWSISSELIPGCIFITFAVVKDEGKADIIEVISVGTVPHEASNKAMSEVGMIRISLVPLFFLTKVTYGTHAKLTEVEIGDD